MDDTIKEYAGTGDEDEEDKATPKWNNPDRDENKKEEQDKEKREPAVDRDETNDKGDEEAYIHGEEAVEAEYGEASEITKKGAEKEADDVEW